MSASPIDVVRQFMKFMEPLNYDEALKLVTTPAYMLAGRISEAAAGIEKLVAEVLRMVKAGA